MRKLIFIALILFVSVSVFAQPTLDLGLKAGVHNSKITANLDQFTSESIVKAHFGAFGRVGWNRIYIQPEAYFSTKGGGIGSTLWETTTKLDFNNIDVPLLLGIKVFKGSKANVRAMAGPVFSFFTSKNVYGDQRFTKQFFEDNYFGFQYGLGVDFWMLTLDLRMEHGENNLYSHPDLHSKNQTFMVTVGFKVL